jgi:hypothetical protein
MESHLLRALALVLMLSAALHSRSLLCGPPDGSEIVETMKTTGVRNHIQRCLSQIPPGEEIELVMAVDPEGHASLEDVHIELKENTVRCIQYAVEKAAFRGTGKAYRITYRMKPAAGTPAQKIVYHPSKAAWRKKLVNGQVLFASGLVTMALGGIATGSSSVFWLESLTEESRYLREHRIPLIMLLCGIAAYGTGLALLLAGVARWAEADTMKTTIPIPEPGLSLGESRMTCTLRWRF